MSRAWDCEQASFRSTDSEGVITSSFIPLHYERNYAYPLLIWLHGPGDNELQLRRVMPFVSLRNYVAVAPRGTMRTAGEAHTWSQEAGSIELAEHRVLAALELATRRFNVSSQRIFLGGYDAGGTMALRVGFRRPDLFAGVASIGGSFPVGHHPLIQFDRVRDLPVLLSHGRDSDSCSEDIVCRNLKLLHAAGISTTLRQYPCGDDLTTQMLRDLDGWMMERVTGESSVRDATPTSSRGFDHQN
ncbi:MAG: hypothetical protein KDA60_13835 [Planctomycetales bacterium]|nr:hypothetical protein [Planctomycetales bacterium]